MASTVRESVSRGTARDLPAWLPGLLVMVALSVVALALGGVEEQVLGQTLIEALVLALLLGVVLRNVVPAGFVRAVNPGAGLAAKQILEVGAALLARPSPSPKS